MSIVDRILQFEEGELNETETVELFADLIKTGTAWKLQGSYGRMANGLIDAGYITSAGEITGKGTRND